MKALIRIISLFLVLIVLLLGCRPNKQSTDVTLRDGLAGTWNVKVVGVDGSSDTHGTFTVMTDNSYRSELVTVVSNESLPVTLQGFIRVQDGFLIETTTNAVPHWLPEAQRGTLPSGGTISRSKIVRLDEHEFVIETNRFGSVLYTR